MHLEYVTYEAAARKSWRKLDLIAQMTSAADLAIKTNVAVRTTVAHPP